MQLRPFCTIRRFYDYARYIRSRFDDVSSVRSAASLTLPFDLTVLVIGYVLYTIGRYTCKALSS